MCRGGGNQCNQADGGAFTLNQIELNSLYDVTGPLSWELQGWFADGSATTLLNGNLQPDTFVTVTPNWSNLISVEFTAYGGGWTGVNNIDVTTAPVPGPVVGAGLPGLIAACGGLFGWWRRKRKAEAPA